MDKFLSLMHGSDKGLTPEVLRKVLTAKVRALMKRKVPREAAGRVISSCGISLDTASRRVTLGGRELRLNAKEFELLQYLMEHSGEAVSKDEAAQIKAKLEAVGAKVEVK